MTLRLIVIAAAVLFLGACANKHPPIEKAEDRPDGFYSMDKVLYQCDGFQPIEVQFYARTGIAVLMYSGRSYELPRHEVEHGFWFSDGRHSIRGNQTRLSLEMDGKMPIICTAANQNPDK